MAILARDGHETAMPTEQHAGEEMDQNENRNSVDASGWDWRSRRSSQQPQISPYQLYYHNAVNSRGRPPTAEEEERFRICVILITTWLFMIVSTLFLLCYVYVLEWSPETSDPIHVFSLEVAVNMLYLMFVIDICAGIAIIVSKMDYMQPFHMRIFWPAVGCLCLNHFHGTLIWLWVWTGEFPRTCARNTFYLGRQCPNLELVMLANADSDGSLDLADCKCDYGQCLPECRGLRIIQNYFWGTYWLYFLRTICLIIYIPPLCRAICQCKCCCCVNPPREETRTRIRRLSRVSAESPLPFVAPDPNWNNNQTNWQNSNNNGICKCNNPPAPKPEEVCSCKEAKEPKQACPEQNANFTTQTSKQICTHCCLSSVATVPKQKPSSAPKVQEVSPPRKVSQGTGESHFAYCRGNLENLK